MKKIRNRLTYANVMSSIAVFLVLGGATAFAATKIGANQLKANSVKTGKIVKEAVTTGKIKKNAVTGAKVNESSLGTVPSANSVNGHSFLAFSKELPDDGAEVTAFEFGGVKFTATCPGGKPVINASNISGVKGAARSSVINEITGVAGNGQSPFSTYEITKGQLGGGTFAVVFENGRVTTVNFAYRDEGFNSGTACRFFGTVDAG